jgi:hypothetical protein
VLSIVQHQQEEFVVERDGEPVAILSPTMKHKSVTLGDLAGRLSGIPLPDSGFSDDVESIQAPQPQAREPEWLI